MKRIVIGISGASGVIYGVRLLQVLHATNSIETHLIISRAAQQTLAIETDYTLSELHALADHVHSVRDIAAPLSSGSFRTEGMVIVPCSIKSLSAIANSYDSDLLIRAADVTLKERKTLVLAIRETPLHRGHLRLMLQAAELGAVVMPLVPAFYHRPKTINDLINQSVNRILDQLEIPLEKDLFSRWRS